MKKIAVVGSVNIDFITTTEQFPKKGETRLGESFSMEPGGKGANQAVALAKLGSNVYFYGGCGNDPVGPMMRDNFEKYGIDTSCLMTFETNSGIASITIADGDNTIVVVPGANYEMTPAYVEPRLHALDQMDFVVMQFEIPYDTVALVLDYCYEKGIPVLLNPAPAPKRGIPPEMIDKATFFTPNETELEGIFGKPWEEVLCSYPNKIIMTKGADGAYYNDGNGTVHVPSIPTKVVDTTGAGDSFNAGFLHEYLKSGDMLKAGRFGACVASLAIREKGAQNAMPTYEEAYALYLEQYGA